MKSPAKHSQKNNKSKKPSIRSVNKLDAGRNRNTKSSKFKFKPVWKIYTLEGCPYCEKAVTLLNKNNQRFLVKEFVKLAPKQKEEVIKKQGRDHQTFPRIFKSKEFIGGFEDLQKLFPSKGYFF